MSINLLSAILSTATCHIVVPCRPWVNMARAPHVPRAVPRRRAACRLLLAHGAACLPACPACPACLPACPTAPARAADRASGRIWSVGGGVVRSVEQDPFSVRWWRVIGWCCHGMVVVTWWWSRSCLRTVDGEALGGGGCHNGRRRRTGGPGSAIGCAVGRQ